ncbi:MAG: FapA family protein [Candidatus Tenebribacter mawsonii]|nr:FapA family protein [Candidatus Tenebribacter mawsonii]
MNEIADGKVYTNTDKSLYLKISKDNFSAYLTIEDKGNMIDEKEISNLLSSVGVKNGLEEAIDYNIKREIIKEVGEPFLIALASVKKAEASIKYNFDIETCMKADQQYEMDELSQFEKVEKDQAIAEISSKEAQSFGADIFGNEVAMNGDSQINVEDIMGNNVHYSAETNQVLATEAGYPYLNHENKICVKSTFISQDIHDTSKTIYGNTTIDGVVSNSNLEIFGNLWVKGNVRGCNKGGIIVHGDVILDYSEDSNIYASGKISINKNARNSLIYANGIIEAEENSSISGGVIQSGERINVFTVGSPLNILTEVEIAIAPFLKEQIRITNKKLTQARNKVEIDEVLITSLVEKLKSLHSQFSSELERSHNTDPSKIIIKGEVFPNSNIRILKDILEISKEKHNIEISVIESGLEINEVDRI